jgi:hypothetical protein
LWVLSLYLYTNIRYNRYSRYIVPINTKEGKMENLRNFGDGSQRAGNDTAGLGEHTDEGLRAMRPEFAEKSDFFFRAQIFVFLEILVGCFICAGDGIAGIARTSFRLSHQAIVAIAEMTFRRWQR